MSAPLTLETLRAYAERSLTPDATSDVERALAHDGPEACDAAAYLLVHRVSSVLLAPTPPSRLSFEALGVAKARWHRRAAAIAALLLLAAGVAWRALDRDAEEPARVRLAHVALADEVPAPEPLLLAGYRPGADGRVAWLDDPTAAASLAKATGRPVLRYVQHPQCPLCRALEAGPFTDAAVLGAFERVVPLKVDIESMARAQVEALMSTGWPQFQLERPDGARLSGWTGVGSTAQVREVMAKALDQAAPTAPASWESLQRIAERDDRRRAARSALLAARADAVRDPAAARRALDDARAALGATPEGEDLARVLAAWRPPAPFPLLEETSR